ncbi:MAG TPA: SOS response-associated peptidase [Acidimicrobiales bacterium]|nr:SOS response-associated peptidase [Acidimicrobiales bacterium]
MCGRIDLHTPPSRLARLLQAELAPGVEPEGAPRWNLPPTEGVLALVARRRPDTQGRVLASFRWGLVPPWAKDPSIGNRMINARAESLASKSAYRDAFADRRCLVVADGFYEWKAPDNGAPGRRLPYYFHRADGAPLAFAGLWERWHDPSRRPEDGTVLRSCTIVTSTAGPDVAPVHDRMPVIVEAGSYDRWLDPDFHDLDALGALLAPSASGTLVSHRVDPAVNNVRNDGPELVEAIVD